MNAVFRTISFFLFLFLIGCEKKKYFHKEWIQTFGTIGLIQFTAANQEEWEYQFQLCKNKIEELNLVFNRYSDQSELSLLNKKKSGVYTVSPSLYENIKIGLEIYRNTKVFDITLLPLLEIWDYKKGLIPTQNQINMVKNQIGSIYLELLPDHKIYKKKDGIRLDLGGLAKGYTVRELVQLLKKNGIKEGIVQIGGDMAVFGDKKRRIGVLDPETKKPGYFFDISNSAIMSSGDYERFFKKDNRIYSHILDPRILSPAIVKAHSVTVIGPDPAIADALATAFFILGPEESFVVLEKYPEYSVFFILPDHTVVKSPSFPYILTKIE